MRINDDSQIFSSQTSPRQTNDLADTIKDMLKETMDNIKDLVNDKGI
jgi:hypothetical protein